MGRYIFNDANITQKTKAPWDHSCMKSNLKELTGKNKIYNFAYKRISAASFMLSEAPILILSHTNQIALEGPDSEINIDSSMNTNLNVSKNAPNLPKRTFKPEINLSAIAVTVR